jgi:hypothetical protein
MAMLGMKQNGHTETKNKTLGPVMNQQVFKRTVNKSQFTVKSVDQTLYRRGVYFNHTCHTSLQRI